MRANAPYYFVPGLSHWPVLGAVAMFFLCWACPSG